MRPGQAVSTHLEATTPDCKLCIPAERCGVLHLTHYRSNKCFLPHVATGCLQGDVTAVLKCWLFFG